MSDRARTGHNAISLEYERPPLVEVALSVEFLPIEGFGALEMAALAGAWSERYPVVREYPPLPAAVPVGAISSGPSVVVNVGAPQLRLWLMSSEEDRLVQIQRDRLILNWRAATDVNPYPRYHVALRPEMERLVTAFGEHLAQRDIPPIRVTAIEVAYVNAVHDDSAHPDLSRTLRSQNHVSLRVGEPIVQRLNQVWQRTQASGVVSTLTLNVDSAALGGGDWLMSFNARSGVTPSADTTDVLAALDDCHDDVVLTFDELITEGRKQEWRRRDD